MDGWSQDVACVHDVISPCTVRHFGRKKKSRTISVVLTDLEASLTLIVDAARFSEQAALFDQVLEAVYSHSCYMKQWRVSHF